MPCTIPISWAELTKPYPRRLSKVGQFGGKLDHPDLRAFMNSTPGTPCCVQVSHCFNMAGYLIPRHCPGDRRGAFPIKIGDWVFHDLLAVDEMEAWLTYAFGAGELLRGAGKTNTSARDIKRAIKDRPGLLTLTGKKDRWHTKFCNGARYLQDDISGGILEIPRIMFWDVNLEPAAWRQDYMRGQGA